MKALRCGRGHRSEVTHIDEVVFLGQLGAELCAGEVGVLSGGGGVCVRVAELPLHVCETTPQLLELSVTLPQATAVTLR